MNKNPREIILAPVISEKSHSDLRGNKYYFKVAPKANKTEIEKAVKAIFNVEVEKVNIINKLGKQKAMGRHKGLTSSWKKAVVTVNKNQKIQGFFEGM